MNHTFSNSVQIHLLYRAYENENTIQITSQYSMLNSIQIYNKQKLTLPFQNYTRLSIKIPAQVDNLHTIYYVEELLRSIIIVKKRKLRSIIEQ